MKFLIYGEKEKAEKLEKILNSLYRSNEFKFLSSTPSTTSVNKYTNDGYLVFRIGSYTGKSYSDKVLNVNFREPIDKVVYDIVNFVDIGVSEKGIVEALMKAR